MVPTMIQEIKIENYRCFKEFSLKDLKRVNLLVGKNNSGKTSIIEGINILKVPRGLMVLHDILGARGEFLDSKRKMFAVGSLCYGYDFKSNNNISISCKNHNSHIEDVFQSGALIKEAVDKSPQLITEQIDSLKYPSYPIDHGVVPAIIEWSLRWKNKEISSHTILSTDADGGVLVNDLSNSNVTSKDCEFLPSSSFNIDKIISIYEEMIFTENEDLVIEALQIIDPSIQKIAPVDGGTNMVVKCKGIKNRVRIGSFGDGIWRLLSLILALVESKNRILLVDEIDTGLHFSVMEDMWRLILKVAEKNNVQVFATTHSNDCWQSLALVMSENPNLSHDSVSIQRIEKGKTKSVSFSEKEIIAAVNNDIEVR